MSEELENKYDPSSEGKFIFVTGGVMSGLGKGITAASIGRLLKDSGFDVTAVKVDPYINVDAGTMNPFEHGEVFVMQDGAEVDLDLGNYERFLGINTTSKNNITTGKVYRSIIEKERRGDFLGNTVQIIPHVTNEIKRRIRDVADGHDICIVEIGGTVGDIEGMPYLESLRQFRQEQDPEDYLHVHVTLVPYSPNGEQKTKPTQHSVKELRSAGVEPDVLVGRCDEKLDTETREKIAMFCDVSAEAVFSNHDVEDVYHVPLLLENEGVNDYVQSQLGIVNEADTRSKLWDRVVTQNPETEIDIALVGKYPMEDAYLSIRESVKHAAASHNCEANIVWVNAEKVPGEHEDRLKQVNGVIIPGGFGARGLEGKIKAAQYARENKIPFLGLCLGFQMAVVEYARNVLGLEDAHSAEVTEDTNHPVIDILPEQKTIDEKGGTMRLGTQETDIREGTLAHRLYDDDQCSERHRHRYEVNPEYIEQLENNGMTFSGRSGPRMEILELEDHPYFIGTQFHPEFRSRPESPSPPFAGFLKALRKEQKSQ